MISKCICDIISGICLKNNKARYRDLARVEGYFLADSQRPEESEGASHI